jgi:hypothetical protein
MSDLSSLVVELWKNVSPAIVRGHFPQLEMEIISVAELHPHPHPEVPEDTSPGIGHEAPYVNEQDRPHHTVNY